MGSDYSFSKLIGRIITPLGLAVLLAAFLFVSYTCGYVFLTQPVLTPGELSQLISTWILPASALGAFLAIWVHGREERTNRTAEVIREFINSDLHRLVDNLIYGGAKGGKRVVKTIVADLQKGDSNVREEAMECVEILSYFERLGMMVEEGSVNSRPILDYFAIALPKIYKALKPLVDFHREQDARAWLGVERLHDQVVAFNEKLQTL